VGQSRFGRLPELAAELVKLKVDVLVTHSTLGTKRTRRLEVSRSCTNKPCTISRVLANISSPTKSPGN
jgi:hypothetical protein